jgi:hypothetical protein
MEKLVLRALGCLTCPARANVALAVNPSQPRVKAVIRDRKAKRLVHASENGSTVAAAGSLSCALPRVQAAGSGGLSEPSWEAALEFAVLMLASPMGCGF